MFLLHPWWKTAPLCTNGRFLRRRLWVDGLPLLPRRLLHRAGRRHPRGAVSATWVSSLVDFWGGREAARRAGTKGQQAHNSSLITPPIFPEVLQYMFGGIYSSRGYIYPVNRSLIHLHSRKLTWTLGFSHPDRLFSSTKLAWTKS